MTSIAEHLSAISGIPPEQISNFACVIVRTDEGPVTILSPDEHSNCIAKMLGEGYLAMTDEHAVKVGTQTIEGFIPDGQE